MEINKNDIPYIDQLLNQLNTTGLVCKQDVMSLESMIGYNIEGINVNSFTTMKSSTNVNNLKASLENIVLSFDKPEERTKDITEVFKLVDVLIRTIDSYVKRLGDNIELNSEVIKDITENCLLTNINVVNEDSTRNNLGTSDIALLNEDKLNYILQTLGAYLGIDMLKNVTNIVNEINALYYNKPKEIYSLLRALVKKDISYRTIYENSLEEVTIINLINEFVVKDRLKLNLTNLKKELDMLKVDLTFDKAFDANVNNNGVKFTYDYTCKKLEDLDYLLKDSMSVNMVILFKVLLIKN